MRKRINPNRGGGLQPYDRPNQTWRCGNEENGCPCSVGPLESGQCPETTECTPVKEGDRWVCNRSEVRGGPCDLTTTDENAYRSVGPLMASGPSPDGQCCMVLRCQPKRTLRVFRGRWARGSAIFALGAILMLLGSSSRNDLLAPGPLTTHHAQVIQRDQWQQRCATCHPGANDSSLAWLGSAIGLTNSRVTAGDMHQTQSSLCLNCHETLLSNQRSPLLAHGISAELLIQAGLSNHRTQFTNTSLTNPIREVSHSLEGSNSESDDALACALCHQEHHGAEHDLLALSNARCQSCHQEQYEGFSTDHPDFSDWPLTGSTRIAFSHFNHQGKHFVKTNQDFDCQICHQKDALGDLSARPNYQLACGSCHDGELRKSFAQGVTLVSLPSINETSLTEAGLPTFDWPVQARNDFDGQLPAIMKLLLASDPIASETMAKLGEDFSFFDINPDDAEQVGLASKIMASVRRLLDEIQEEGHDAIGYRLKKISGKEELDADLAEYVANLPIEYLDQLQAAWFNAAGTVTTDTFDEIEDRESTGGWRLDSEKLSLIYHPTGHDDSMLKAWLDLIVALPNEHSQLRDACLREFSQPGAPGSCLTCHSIQTSAKNQLTISWRGRNRLTEPKGFTHFSHRPHLTQPELADCTACHQTNSSQQTMSLVGNRSANSDSKSAQDFLAIQKTACTQCHQPNGAGENCTQCHNYHVDPHSLEANTLRSQLQY